MCSNYSFPLNDIQDITVNVDVLILLCIACIFNVAVTCYVTLLYVHVSVLILLCVACKSNVAVTYYVLLLHVDVGILILLCMACKTNVSSLIMLCYYMLM